MRRRRYRRCYRGFGGPRSKRVPPVWMPIELPVAQLVPAASQTTQVLLQGSLFSASAAVSDGGGHTGVLIKRILLQLGGKVVVGVATAIYQIVATIYFRDENDNSQLLGANTVYATSSDVRERQVYQAIREYSGAAGAVVSLAGTAGEAPFVIDCQPNRRCALDDNLVIAVTAYRLNPGRGPLVAPDEVDVNVLGKLLIVSKGEG